MFHPTHPTSPRSTTLFNEDIQFEIMPYPEELDQSMERFFDFQAVEDLIQRREPVSHSL